MTKRSYELVDEDAYEQHPYYSRVARSADYREHQRDEADIEKIRYNEYLLFAVFSDKERRDEIRPERGVAGYRDYQRILTRRAGALIVIHPAENTVERAFEEAYPAGERDYPEIFILRYRLERINKFYTDNMGLCLDYLLLDIDIDEQGYQKSDEQHRRIENPIYSHIVEGVVVCYKPRRYRQEYARYRRRKILDNASYREDIRALYRVGRKDIYKALVGIDHEIIEELEADIEQQDDYALHRQRHMLIRHPHEADAENYSRDTHGQDIRAVLTFHAARIVNHLRAQCSQREARENAEYIYYIERTGGDTDSVAY